MNSIKLLDVCKEYHSILLSLQKIDDENNNLRETANTNYSNYLYTTDDQEARQFKKTLYSSLLCHQIDVANNYDKLYARLIAGYLELVDKIEPGMRSEEFEKKYIMDREGNN